MNKAHSLHTIAGVRRPILSWASLVVIGFLAVSYSEARATWPSDPSVNVPVSKRAGSQQHPVIASDGQGGSIIVWQDATNTRGWDIWAQRVNADGVVQWAANGVPVCRAEGAQVGYVIAPDGAGGAIIAWIDLRFSSLGGRNAIYAQHLNSLGRPVWHRDGIQIDSTGSSYVLVAPDGRGGAFLVYDDDRAGVYVTTDMYAQRVDRRGRALWAGQGVPVNDPNDNASYHYPVALIVDGQGGIITTWEDNRTRTNYDPLFAQRLDSLGTPQWQSDGVQVAEHPVGFAPDDLLSDGQGGAFVSWINVPDPTGPMAQHVNSDGAVLWPAPGLDLGGDVNSAYPYITTDMAGGFIACWADGRGPGYPYSPYAQRANAAGALLWPASGVLLSSTSLEFPRIASDGAGGAIVVWNDYRSGVDVYGQRVTPDGSIAPGWPVDGVAISTATASQWYPVLLAVPGGAIVTWEDTRTNGIEDIYAQRVLNDGTLGAPVNGTHAAAVGAHLSFRAEDRPGAVQRNGMVLAPPLVNPARSQAALSFSLASGRPVQMNAFDLNGRLVRRILDGPVAAGEHTSTWNLRDETGARVPPGVYIIAIAEGPAHRVLVFHE